jgi:glycosyltransferase involved in cell wall biosynthesis
MIYSTGDEPPPPRAVPLGYLVSQYPTVTHTFILREIRTLRTLGFDVRVVSIRQPDRRPDRLSPEEAEEFRLTFCVLGGGLRPVLRAHLRTLLLRPRAYVATLLYAIRLGGWDLRRAASHACYFAEAVVVGDYLVRAGTGHFHTHFASTPALIASRLFRIPFSLTIHGSGEFDDVAAFHMAEKVAQATFVATISKFGSSQTMRASAPRYWGKIHALPLGVDPDDFAPRPQSNPAPAGPFRIVCVGTLAPAKAYPMLIAAIARLVEKGREVELTIVGEGPERQSLEQAIVERRLGGVVRLAGACNHDGVIDFYARTNAFALASFAEGVPVVLMEAMAMRIPCVATWVAGVPELIRDGIDGLLVAPADPEALANALERLMDDPALGARLGDSARLRVLESYNLSRNSARLGETFRQYCVAS